MGEGCGAVVSDEGSSYFDVMSSEDAVDLVCACELCGVLYSGGKSGELVGASG